MKTLSKIFTLLLTMGLLCQCSSDDDSNTSIPLTFETLIQSDIENLEGSMSDDAINASNESGILLEAGTVILYKTKSGRFGKLKLLNIDAADNYKLTVEAVTYARDGLVYNSNNFLEVRGTFSADLDEVTTEVSAGDRDFWWERASSTATNLIPRNGAVFMTFNPNP